jgi:hypothetical protein
LITPPWHTAATRPAGKSFDDRVDARHDAALEHLGIFTADVLPPAFDHRPPMVVPDLAQLLDGDVEIRARVVFPELVVDVDVNAEFAADDIRRFARSAQRAGHDGVEVLVLEPAGETPRLPATALRQRRIGRSRRGSRHDALGLGVADQEEVHGLSR